MNFPYLLVVFAIDRLTVFVFDVIPGWLKTVQEVHEGRFHFGKGAVVQVIAVKD